MRVNLYKKGISLILLCCLLLSGCKQPSHQHTFGDWTLKETSTCAREGLQERVCSACNAVDTRPIPKEPHMLNNDHICKLCRYVDFDPTADFAELGAFSNYWFSTSTAANSVWDVKIWNGKVYRGIGDYDKNAGTAPLLAYDIATQSWVVTGHTADQAIQRFVQIGETLYAPGIDPIKDWTLGNFYVLGEETWKQVRNLPNGLHNFDMIGFDGKIFAGLGTEVCENTVAVSLDQGESFTFVPLYRDGVLLDTAGYEYSRTYAFVEYNGDLYALVTFKKTSSLSYDRFIFRYEDGKMVYQSAADSRLTGKTGRNFWQGKLEWRGTCYLTSTALNAVTDFSKPETHRQISMPNMGVVSDILLHNDQLYVLSYTFWENTTCRVVIYKSATGQEGSFTEVVSFDYVGIPISFDFDGNHFYIGIGNSYTNPSKSGMMLRVKPAA